VPEPGEAPLLTGIFCPVRRILRAQVLLALLVVTVAADLCAAEITIRGTVKDRKRGTAVSSAVVTIVDRLGTVLGTTTTDAQGQWQKSIAVTDVALGSEPPREFSVGQNYPNPFNPSTKIPFSIEKQGRVRVSVYNILGQILDEREAELQPGSYIVDFHSAGSAGVLFYSVEMNNIRRTGKMIQLDGGRGRGFGGFSRSAAQTSLNLAASYAFDSCRVITSSLVYETDTTTIAFRDSVRADIMLDTVHDRAFLIDLHNDIMEQIAASGFTYQLADRHTTKHTDIPRLRDGGVDAQVFSIWVSPTSYAPSIYFATAKKFIDSMKAQVGRNAKDVEIVLKKDSLDVFARQNRIAGLLVVEGGHCIEDNLENLRVLYNEGVRMMTITWKNSTSWAVSDQDTRAATVGLNDFGKQVIRTMDSLGMIIDVSHVGKKTIEDILATSTNPIIASHSGAYTLANNSRNLTDSQILALAGRGGVIGVVFYPYYLTGSRTASLDNVIQHIDYIKNLTKSVDCIALGSDFDGIEVTPQGLENVTRFPAITEALLQRGYSREDVRKILGGNFMRVFRAVCK
jgi:membrane dipeptidase